MENVAIAFFYSLASPSAPWIALVVCSAVLVFVYILKSGILTIKTEKILLGKAAAENEQIILRRQFEHIVTVANGTFSAIPRHEKFDEWRTRFVIEKVIDEFVNLCVFNHLDTSERYIRLKQVAVWNIIQKYIWNEVYQSIQFHSFVDDFVKDMIVNLVAIRREYSK